MSENVPKTVRDQRLDFFRGLAMFIILFAHTPGNAWTLWIPARFGFSDATEIFVFCSGMASALAFGAVFANYSWLLGTARIVFRIWQVYWAHIGVVLATALLMVALDKTGLGTPGKVYADWFPVNGIFNKTHETLFGLFTLSYIPGLFDILPMYLVILALVPVVMTAHKFGGKEAAMALVVLMWLVANLAGYARHMREVEDLTAFQHFFVTLGQGFTWMNFPASPTNPNPTWFFNPFGWQLVFFTGFAFAMRWLPAPPITRALVWLAVAVIVITMPLAWHKMFQYYTGFLPEHLGGAVLWDVREAIEPFRWKSWVGLWRYVHFLAVGYLAFAAVGPLGARLNTGWSMRHRSGQQRKLIRLLLAPVLILTLPYVYVDEIKWIAPALDRFILANYPLLPGRYIGLAQLLHLAAFIPFVWHSVGDNSRQWLLKDGFLSIVPVIRKVGTQSLAVFLVSIVLSRFNGWWMDSMDAYIDHVGWTYLQPRDVWMVLLVNGTGIAILIATAFSVGWFKSQPWRQRRPAKIAQDKTQEPVATPRPVV
ncbi:MAG: OpgC family protein [Pikeienuella sp.]